MIQEDLTIAPVLRGFLLSLLGLLTLCFAVELVRSTMLHRPEGTYSAFFFAGWFPDLLMHVGRFTHFHSAEFFRFKSDDPFVYPAPMAVMYQLFYVAPGGPVVAYLLFSLGTLAVFGGLFVRALVVRGVAWAEALPFALGVLLCSYPVMFMIRQGNLEAVVLLLLTSGIVLFLSGKEYAASICFGLAASLKIYPLVFFGLFLRRGQISRMALGMLVFALSELGSLWLVCPQLGVSWHGISDGLAIFRDICMVPIRPEIAQTTRCTAG